MNVIGSTMKWVACVASGGAVSGVVRRVAGGLPGHGTMAESASRMGSMTTTDAGQCVAAKNRLMGL